MLALAGSVVLNLVLLGLYYGGGGLDSVQERFYSHDPNAPDKVAIISIEGLILEGEGFVKRQIDHAMKDPGVKAVVLRVDSPGGTVTGSDFIYHHLSQLREKKPLVVSMGGIAASGGYYVSMAVGDKPETIFAEPTTWTGSIGVVIPHYNVSDLMKNWGVQDDSIASHRLKTMGSFTKPMTPEERLILQELVDDSFGRFKEIVKSGRPKFRNDAKALDTLATGQIFTANQALKGGLVDKIGFLDAAVDRAIALANLNPVNVRVVKYKREVSFASALMDSSDSEARLPGLEKLLEMASPRAYFLWTALPPLVTNRAMLGGRSSGSD
jgi:protease-4